MPHATRRAFLENVAISTLAASATGIAGTDTCRNVACANDAASTFEVGSNVRQLFLDDVGIASIEGLRQVVNPPTKHPDNPLIKPDTQWERGCQVYGTACYDEQAGRFRIWYLTGPKDRGARPLEVDGYERPPHTTLVAYAESDDGVQWTKPDLGQFPYDGDRHNNLTYSYWFEA